MMQRAVVETGRFITFEGGEGSGKSTQAGILANRLTRAGRQVFSTREPGGTPAAEEIREALLAGKVWQYGPFAEALMFSVARADHVENAIGQALLSGKWVVCDRFLDSTRAYQGATAGVPRALISALERVTLSGLLPDITFILDIPPEEGLARAAERRGVQVPDRFESQELMLHERVRRAFLDIAEEEPDRCVVIDASQPEAMVAEDVWEVVLTRLSP
jgi:dTMP kinase